MRSGLLPVMVVVCQREAAAKANYSLYRELTERHWQAARKTLPTIHITRPSGPS